MKFRTLFMDKNGYVPIALVFVLLTSALFMTLFPIVKNHRMNQYGELDVANKLTELPKEKLAFPTCFEAIDTLNTDKITIGCDSYYKKINEKYIIEIILKEKLRLGDCKTLALNQNTGGFMTKLHIFNKGEAHLGNLCTDLYVNNLPKPTRNVDGISGLILFSMHSSKKRFKKMSYHVSIYIDEITFFDKKTNQEVIIKDELLWRVLNLEPS